MNSIHRRIAAVTDSMTHLIAELRELDQLREQVRQAVLKNSRVKGLNRSGRPRVLSRRAADLPTACRRQPRLREPSSATS